MNENEPLLERRNFLKFLALNGVIAISGIQLNTIETAIKNEVSTIFDQDENNKYYKTNYINTSIFDIFKIGLGPSSSHTIAPMKAAFDFINNVNKLDISILNNVEKIKVRLFGSLSATGKNHGTDRAIVAGLLGYIPQNCPETFFDNIFKNKDKNYQIKLMDKTISFTYIDIIFDKIEHNYPYSNTIIFDLYGTNKKLYEKEYYSVGGGFIEWKGFEPKAINIIPFKYSDMEGLKKIINENKLKLHNLVLENETAISNQNRPSIIESINKILNVMDNSVNQGFRTNGVLPGFLRLTRKAPILYSRVGKIDHDFDKFLLDLNSAAFAVAEENAVGHRVVTAPTLGSAGVIPALIFVAKKYLNLSHAKLINGFIAAAAIGSIVKYNASFAGADVGCQGEIGVASAMAAAMLTYAKTNSIKCTENAATIALEHHLGLTCNPVGGYVQIPCIERNAIGASKAYSAYIIATNEKTNKHIPDFDTIVTAMNLTGKDMDPKYKETSTDYLGKWRPKHAKVSYLKQRSCSIC